MINGLVFTEERNRDCARSTREVARCGFLVYEPRPVVTIDSFSQHFDPPLFAHHTILFASVSFFLVFFSFLFFFLKKPLTMNVKLNFSKLR